MSAEQNGPAVVLEDASEVAAGTATPARRKGPSRSRKADHVRPKAARREEVPVSVPLADIPVLDLRKMRLTIVSLSPLIVHRFNKKQREQMLNKQMGKATEGRKFKVPEDDYRDSLYLMPDGKTPGFPCSAFKKAAVSACTSLGRTITKTAVLQAFHVEGDLTEIEGTHAMREDVVRVGQGKGTADIRYRAQFDTWKVSIVIEYNARVISDIQIMNLFNVAGFGVGIGEWRPEKGGQFGRFKVL